MKSERAGGGRWLRVKRVKQQSTEARDVSAAMRFIRLHKNMYLCVS